MHKYISNILSVIRKSVSNASNAVSNASNAVSTLIRTSVYAGRIQTMVGLLSTPITQSSTLVSTSHIKPYNKLFYRKKKDLKDIVRKSTETIDIDRRTQEFRPHMIPNLTRAPLTPEHTPLQLTTKGHPAGSGHARDANHGGWSFAEANQTNIRRCRCSIYLYDLICILINRPHTLTYSKLQSHGHTDLSNYMFVNPMGMRLNEA